MHRLDRNQNPKTPRPLNNTILSKLLADHPIVITGLGAYSAAGESVSDLWQAAKNATSAAVWKEYHIGGSARKFAVCCAPPLDPIHHDLRAVRKMDRSVQMGWIAANQALQQANLFGTIPPARIGVAIGTSRGPLEKLLESFSSLDKKRLLPTQAADSTFASLAGILAQKLKLNGPGATLSATCASSAFAIAFAAEQIILGKADAMLAGGADAPLQPYILSQFASAGMLGDHEDAARVCRPFDISRNGIALGEGSGFLVLESARSAAARGAKPLAHLSGWCTKIEDSGRTGIHKSGAGLLDVMEEALKLAGVKSQEIGYINAHGTGTKLNDAAEAMAFTSLMNESKSHLSFGSTKPVTGHCLGVTSALEAIICTESLRHQMIPPSANCFQPDPICPEGSLVQSARPCKIKHVMSNSLGFWGHHAALVFSKAT